VARNNGVAASKGEYLCFLDADDWWEPTFLENMAKLINRIPHAGIYGTNYWIVKNGKKKIAPIGIDDGFTEGAINYCQVYAKTLCMPLWTGAVCMPRSIFDEINGFNPNLKLGEDFDLWIRIALKYPVVFLNKSLSNYYQDADTNYRGSCQKEYKPESFMTFHFDQFSNHEKTNPDLKKLLDRIRVYTLMNFRKKNLFPEKVRAEIEKVDFSNVAPIYRFYYHAPFWIVNIYLKTLQTLYLIKKRLL
jgi:glycosyltransferase involved in cell wall biosynthesis